MLYGSSNSLSELINFARSIDNRLSYRGLDSILGPSTSFDGHTYSLVSFAGLIRYSHNSSGSIIKNCPVSGNFIRYSHDCSGSIIKNCLASGYFINYSFVCLFVDSFRGLWYSLNRWIDNKFVNTLRGFKYSQFDRGFFNFDYLVSLFKYSLNNRLNDSFLNDNFVSSFVGVLICSLDKQFDKYFGDGLVL